MKRDDMAFSGEANEAMKNATRHFGDALTKKTLEAAQKEKQRVATKWHVMVAIAEIFSKERP